MRPLPTLRQLLLLLALACVLPMAALAIGLMAYAYQHERDEIQNGTVATARALITALDDHFHAAPEGARQAPQPASALEVDQLLQRLLAERHQLRTTWVASVVDRSGTVLARSQTAAGPGPPVDPGLLERLAVAGEDALVRVGSDGVPVTTAFSRSSRSGWSVLIDIPEAELWGPLVRASLILLAGAMTVLGATLYFAWRLSRSLSASVEALGGAVRATGHRAHLRLPEPVFQEARQLGLAFAHGHAALQDANAALARSEARMRAILATARDAIVSADESGRIVLFNPAAEALFGLRSEDAIGQPVESLVPPAERERHQQYRLEAREGHARRMARVRPIQGLRGDGTTFEAEASISVTSTDGNRLYTIVLRWVPGQAPRPPAYLDSMTSEAVRKASTAAGNPQ